MPDHIVIKKAGKFEIVPSDADIARAKAKEDKVKVKARLTEAEMGELLERILLRLEALERAGV